MWFAIAAFAFVVPAVVAGLVIVAKDGPQGQQGRRGGQQTLGSDRSGWIYFVGEPEGDSPIKIGMTKHEPTLSRIPDLQTMSPVKLKLFFKAFVPDRYETEAALHRELGEYRSHGEWFDRDMALAWADHLRGEW